MSASYLTLRCPSCGAGLPDGTRPGRVVRCTFCGVSHRTPTSATPEPDMGDLLLGADFAADALPGWRVVDRDATRFVAGDPPRLARRFVHDGTIRPVVRTAGPMDDLDASVTIRFDAVEGSLGGAFAGFEFGFDESHGELIVRVAPSGHFAVAVRNADGSLAYPSPWRSASALRKGLGADNRLRALVAGGRLRVWLNGALACSLRDRWNAQGLFRVVAGTLSSAAHADISFADLRLCDVRQAEDPRR